MEQVRWGIVGTARIATRKVIPALQRAGNCHVQAIGSRDERAARSEVDRLGIPSAYGSYEDVLADDQVDAVYVPLPNHLHAEWTIAAAQAGKHVLCEKPLALHARDAQRMVDAAEEAGVRFMEAFMYRLHPSWQRVADLVASGTIGELRSVQSWFSYDNDDPSDIRNIPEAGGGALMDIGCYGIDLSRWLCGGEPEEVAGVMHRDPELGVDTTTSALLRFGDATASFTCSTRAKPDQYVVVHGTEGRIALDTPFNIRPDLPTRVQLDTGPDLPGYATPEVFEIAPADPYTVQGERFAQAVLEDREVPTPPREGVATMRVLERVVAAAG
jgi:predicted dehydrogenase